MTPDPLLHEIYSWGHPLIAFPMPGGCCWWSSREWWLMDELARHGRKSLASSSISHHSRELHQHSLVSTLVSRLDETFCERLLLGRPSQRRVATRRNHPQILRLGQRQTDDECCGWWLIRGGQTDGRHESTTNHSTHHQLWIHCHIPFLTAGLRCGGKEGC